MDKFNMNINKSSQAHYELGFDILIFNKSIFQYQ